ncbi:MAG: GAF domain-containing protein, partial [candidate division KSB1 bacterium]|nr:GAF domain-containing protein [candidate division KSB1 bacterium]
MTRVSKTREVITEAPVGGAMTFEETLYSLLNEALITIKATGGSVMLMDARREWLVIQARLGPPRPERREEPRFRVDERSIAGYVASTGRSYRCPNVENDSHFAPPRLGQLGFRSLLCVPILTAEGVLGVINADHEEANFFTEEDERRLWDLAQRLSGVVLERQRFWRILDSLHNVGASLARLSPEGRVADALQNIVNQAVNLLGADVVTLYQYDQSRQHFPVEGTGPTIAGHLLVPGPMRTRVYPDDVPWKIVQQGVSRYFLDTEHDDFLIGKVPARDGLPERPRFVVREGIKSSAALVLRAGDEIVGIMFANYRSCHEFTEDEKRILETFANYAAIAIKNARLLDELKQIQEHRLAAERWATLGKAAANLAHRINNTVGLVPVAVQDLKELLAQVPMPREVQEPVEGDLQRIERNTRFTLELADVLLKPFTGGPTEQLDVNALLEKAVTLSSLPNTIQSDLNLSPHLPLITTSPLLVDVFVELISNAVKAMPDGGRLEIGSRLGPANQIEIWFSDTGTGIPAEQQDKVFDLFFTTHQESLGFGLWWVKTFILQQGGTIKLESQVGQGTTFKIYL